MSISKLRILTFSVLTRLILQQRQTGTVLCYNRNRSTAANRSKNASADKPVRTHKLRMAYGRTNRRTGWKPIAVAARPMRSRRHTNECIRIPVGNADRARQIIVTNSSCGQWCSAQWRRNNADWSTRQRDSNAVQCSAPWQLSLAQSTSAWMLSCPGGGARVSATPGGKRLCCRRRQSDRQLIFLFIYLFIYLLRPKAAQHNITITKTEVISYGTYNDGVGAHCHERYAKLGAVIT